MNLTLHSKKGKPRGHIRVCLWIPFDSNQAAAVAVDSARQGVHYLDGGNFAALSEGIDGANCVILGSSDAVKALAGVLAKLDVFMKLGDKIAQVSIHTIVRSIMLDRDAGTPVC